MVVNVYSTSVTSENISRFELLAWVNDCLQSKLTKIEEMATGAAYCQLTDFAFPNRVPMKKVKWNSRQEVDWLANWGILQRAWKDIGIDKPVPVQNLMRAKFQDNFEFLQWFKKFFDANYDGHEYDPAAARNYEEFPATLPNGGANKRQQPPVSAPASARPPMARTAAANGGGASNTGGAQQQKPPPMSRGGGGGRFANAGPTTTKPTSTVAASTRTTAARPQSHNSSSNSSFTGRTRQSTGAAATNNGTSSRASTTVTRTPPTPKQQPPRGGVGGAAGGAGNQQAQQQLAAALAEVGRWKQRAETLEAEKNEIRQNGDICERERNFYLDKLRQIEVLCGHAGSGGKLEVDEVQHILFDRSESRTTGRTANRSGTSATSSEPRGDAIPPPLDSPDERMLHQMMEERAQCLSGQGSNKNIAAASNDIDGLVVGSGGHPGGNDTFASVDLQNQSENSNNDALDNAYLEDTCLSVGEQPVAAENNNTSALAGQTSNNTFNKDDGPELNVTHPVISSDHANVTHPVIGSPKTAEAAESETNVTTPVAVEGEGAMNGTYTVTAANETQQEEQREENTSVCTQNLTDSHQLLDGQFNVVPLLELSGEEQQQQTGNNTSNSTVTTMQAQN